MKSKAFYLVRDVAYGSEFHIRGSVFDVVADLVKGKYTHSVHCKISDSGYNGTHKKVSIASHSKADCLN